MAFDSRHEVSISSPASVVYTTFSSLDGFKRFMHLSPTCHSVEILKTDQIVLHTPADFAGRSLEDLSVHRPTYELLEPTQAANAEGEHCSRVHFKMIERIPLLFGLIKNDVTILGTQITSQSLKLHIYESEANKGLVKIYKLRQFAAQGKQTTKIEELISGKTIRLLRWYTQSSCRHAHQRHMQSYQSCF